MSDFSQGPGWWQASDGKWYSPEQAPGAQPTPTPATPPAASFGAPGMPAPGPAGGGFGAPMQAGGSFSVGDAFNWGFKKFQENLGPIILASLIVFAAVAVLEIIIWVVMIGSLTASTTVDQYGVVHTSGGGFGLFLFGYGAFMIVMMLGSYLVQMAIIRATLMITNGEQVTLNRMFSTERIGTFIAAAVLVVIGTYIGMVLCFIPGLIFMFFSFFFGWFVIDKQMGAVESIQASFRLVNQNMGTCVGLIIGSFIAYAVGAILCGIGLLVAIPVIVLATGYSYRRMQGEAVAA